MAEAENNGNAAKPSPFPAVTAEIQALTFPDGRPNMVLLRIKFPMGTLDVPLEPEMATVWADAMTEQAAVAKSGLFMPPKPNL